MAQFAVGPLYTDFDAEGATFLGTHLYSDYLFDVYICESVCNLKEIIAVPADHDVGGPIAMESTLCSKYQSRHPLHVGYLIAKKHNLL